MIDRQDYIAQELAKQPNREQLRTQFWDVIKSIKPGDAQYYFPHIQAFTDNGWTATISPEGEIVLYEEFKGYRRYSVIGLLNRVDTYLIDQIVCKRMVQVTQIGKLPGWEDKVLLRALPLRDAESFGRQYDLFASECPELL